MTSRITADADTLTVGAKFVLRGRPCGATAKALLVRLSPDRQLAAAQAMVLRNDYSVSFARLLLVSTPFDEQRAGGYYPRMSQADQRAANRLIGRLLDLQRRWDACRQDYGRSLLQLTVLQMYLRLLLDQVEVVKWLALHRQDALVALQRVADLELTRKPQAAFVGWRDRGNRPGLL